MRGVSHREAGLWRIDGLAGICYNKSKIQALGRERSDLCEGL